MSVPSSTYDEAILTVIDREYRPLRHAAKILAGHAKASYRTAQDWLYGRSVPTGESFMNLMIASETLADEIMRVVAERKSQQGK